MGKPSNEMCCGTTCDKAAITEYLENSIRVPRESESIWLEPHSYEPNTYIISVDSGKKVYEVAHCKIGKKGIRLVWRGGNHSVSPEDFLWLSGELSRLHSELTG